MYFIRKCLFMHVVVYSVIVSGKGYTIRFYDVSLALYLLSDEDDLFEVTDYLKNLEKTHIYHLGLVLGLRQNKVKTMMDSVVFLDDVIAAWLRKEDKVTEKGEPSWTVLVDALKHHRVGQTGIANTIAKDKGHKLS